MHRSGLEEVRQVQRFDRKNVRMDNGQVKRLARECREQLTIGALTDADERALRQLAVQIRTRKVRVKFFLRHSLHAKLYLCFPKLTVLPGLEPVMQLCRTLGYGSSSNLLQQGE